MAAPKVEFNKADGQTGVVRPGPEGLAIIAPSASGTANQATSVTRWQQALSTFGPGRLPELLSHVLTAGKPLVGIKTNATTVGTYDTFTVSSGGTAEPEAGTTTPLDDFDVLVTFTAGTPTGGLGDAGALYWYSLDGGRTRSAVQALGTALNIVIPDTGITIVLGEADDTIPAGKTIAFKTTAPRANSTDDTAALEALRVTALAWEGLLLDGPSDAARILALDTWLKNLEENTGKYRFGIVNVALKGAQTEAEYRTALQAIRAAAFSTRVFVCADGGDLVSAVRGIRMVRPTALALAERLMAIDLATEPAYVNDGPVTGFSILDERGGPKYHNEDLFPGIDDLRMVTLNTFEGRSGAYITNGWAFSPDNSDYQLIPHVRVINRLCESSQQVLTSSLSANFTKSPNVGPSGQRYISESSAGAIEADVQAVVDREGKGRVNAAKFTLNRDDDVSSNSAGEVTGRLEIEALGYLKKIRITTGYVRSISAQAA